MTIDITFYFDPISPYSWLAAHRIQELKSSGVVVHCVPVLFAGLLHAFGQKGPAEIESKRRYTFLDVHRRANAARLDFLGPPTHPFNPLIALRACHCLDDQEQRFALATTLMDMAWAQGEDITGVDAVHKAALRCQIEIPELETQLQNPEVKARLKKSTQSAIEHGVFGVPMLRVNDELFWGSDRVSDAYEAARGTRVPIDRDLVDKVLARPASATRK